MSFNSLVIGNKYSKKDLSEIFDNPNISKIREGIYNVSQSESFFFVDLEKKGKEERFHFDDFFEGDYFHWDSQTTQHINTPKIQEIVHGDRTPHLMIRITPKIKNVTQPFVYCGRLKHVEYEEGTSKPVHIIFQNIDFQDDTDNEELFEIYSWKPNKIGKTPKSNITKRGVISKKRVRNYKKPNKTERSGLVTSRVGQGYYRQQIREKWNNRCPVTDCDVLSMRHGLEIRTPYLDVDSLNKFHFDKIKSKFDFVSQFKGFPINLMSKQKTGFTLPFEKWLTKNNEDYLNLVIKNLDEKFAFDQNYLKDIFFNNVIKGKYAWLRKWQLIVLSNWASVKL